MRDYIALIDCDNFFVSCERLFRPDLTHKPVLVLSSNDGCVISRSKEVKQLGIHMGEPYFKIRDLCERHKVVLFSSNFELYRDLSNRVMSTLRHFSESIEEYSIDEAFIHLTPPASCATQVLQEEWLMEKACMLRNTLRTEIGIPVSVGIATTKTLAKAATHLAKTCGCVVLTEEATICSALKKIPVGNVWGIGRSYVQKLERNGVHTAFDLYEKDEDWVRKELHVTGLRTAAELRGVLCFSLGTGDAIRKSLLSSQSFGTKVTSLHSLETAVAGHARSIAETLRNESILAKEVGVFILHAGKEKKHTHVYEVERLPTYTNDTFLIVKTARTLLQRLYRRDGVYKKAGVAVRSIIPVGAQPNKTLFGEETNSNERLMETLDTIRHTHGEVIKLGIEIDTGTWRARRAHLSPRYTTRWSEINTILST